MTISPAGTGRALIFPARARPLMKNKQLGSLFLVSVIDILGFGILIPLVPYMANRYGASPTVITAIFGVYSLCQFIAAPFWGRLSDRLGAAPSSFRASPARACRISFSVRRQSRLAVCVTHPRWLHGGQHRGRFRLRIGCQPAREARGIPRHGRRGHRRRLHARAGDRRHPGGKRSPGREFRVARRGVSFAECVGYSLVAFLLPESNTAERRREHGARERVGPLRLLSHVPGCGSLPRRRCS